MKRRADNGSEVVGRLAPTPSGDLHLGNVCAFGAAWLSVRSQGGTLLLRMEDVDTTRSRAEIEDRQRFDLEWLGLTWDRETPRQSERDYEVALSQLRERGHHLYYCQCTRKDLRKTNGVYPGTCRQRGLREGKLRFQLESGEVEFVDRRYGPRAVDPAAFGDPVLRRRDGVWAYNLAVVADDIEDGVTEVVRGADLLDFSAVQIVLWRALGATPPTWLHSPLIVGADDRKLSKSHGSLHVGALRDSGWEPADIWQVVLPWLGIERSGRLDEAVEQWVPAGGELGPIEVSEDLSGPGHLISRTLEPESLEQV